MTGITDPCHPEAVRVAASHQAEATKIAAELAAIAATGMVLPGSITQRRTRCGHPNCACHADPPRLHGPYWQWTRKVAARTVCRWLSPGQQHDYQAWINNDRRLRDLLARLEALGPTRSTPTRDGSASPGPLPATHARPGHNTVATARLTCGHAPSQLASSQVSAKREDLTHPIPAFSHFPALRSIGHRPQGLGVALNVATGGSAAWFPAVERHPAGCRLPNGALRHI